MNRLFCKQICTGPRRNGARLCASTTLRGDSEPRGAAAALAVSALALALAARFACLRSRPLKLEHVRRKG